MSDDRARFAELTDRAILAVAGEDRANFLQGLVSNDVLRVSPEQAAYALFLTPQGKYLHEFRMADLDGALLLDPEAARLPDLAKRLKMYKLRSKIALEDRSAAMTVVAVFGGDALDRLGLPARAGAAVRFGDGIAFVDPRLPALGARIFLPREGAGAQCEAAGLAPVDAADYDRFRLSLGIPESGDLVPEKSLALENRLDSLNAISWDKGCYMGQELTARTKYRALIKKKLFPVTVDGALPAPGTPVLLDGEEVGELRTGRDTQALALLRLEEAKRALADGIPLRAGDAALSVGVPAWATE